MSSRLRQEYPSIAPWQWEAHPEWLERVWTALDAEDEAYDATHPKKPT